MMWWLRPFNIMRRPNREARTADEHSGGVLQIQRRVFEPAQRINVARSLHDWSPVSESADCAPRQPVNPYAPIALGHCPTSCVCSQSTTRANGSKPNVAATDGRRFEFALMS